MDAMKIQTQVMFLEQWLNALLPSPISLQPMASGAGLRRYFRVTSSKASFIAMVAPADAKSSNFIHLSREFQSIGIQTPIVHAADLEKGFLLLTDFGDNLYGNILNSKNASLLYQQAFLTLLRIQAYGQAQKTALQLFDMTLYRQKMNWFIEFFLQAYLGLELKSNEITQCEYLFDLLIDTARGQPKVCVHYDFHCRNLLSLPGNQVGVLDFQDAVLGPVTYDLMSLLRDCYIHWPQTQVHAWMEQYHQQALQAKIITMDDPRLWRRWCDFTSLQRHIKCIGLFARFHILNHSSDYLSYIPRMLNYLRQISSDYPETTELNQLLNKIGLP